MLSGIEPETFSLCLLPILKIVDCCFTFIADCGVLSLPLSPILSYIFLFPVLKIVDCCFRSLSLSPILALLSFSLILERRRSHPPPILSLQISLSLSNLALARSYPALAASLLFSISRFLSLSLEPCGVGWWWWQR